ncbi:MAG TPA: CbiQ family ECF transporter T component [Candidatus Caenarcaniphilales bacterium]
MDLLRSLPLGLYLEQPITWLHQLDPRVKLAWLLTFLISPLLANASWRLLLVGLLIFLTLAAAIPVRVWWQQISWLLLLSLLILSLTAILPDGIVVHYQPRLPVDELSFSESPAIANTRAGQQRSGSQTARRTDLPQPTSYRYVLFKQGPVTVTRRSLELGIRTSTLLFTLIYGTNLYLLTTAPEEITAGLERLMQPLRRLNWPVTEISLTLTLSLRFIPLVLEEVQNLIRSVRTRAINWKKLGVRGALQIWLMLADRLLENLFLRAEQIAGAMQVRGFTSPNQHQVQWNLLRLGTKDLLALGCLGLVWSARFWLG